jgi:phenylalanyl-tRNA synthetase beta chain
MKVSLRWLQDYIDLNCPPEEMLERLTMGGTEVESQQTLGVKDPHVVVAEVLSYVPHPNADRLRLCQVSTGTETRQIVCGARNFEVGSRVPLALPGAELPGGFKIKESKLRGELSQGMMCSAKELALDEEAEGLLILPLDTPVGKKLSEVIPSDLIFDLEVTPNRPDLLSYIGLARELAALGCGKRKLRSETDIAWPTNAVAWSLQLEDAKACPFYSAVLLDEVKVGPSPAWLQEKIRATGHRPINNVVDITNLVLWETGQPLHTFDATKLSGGTVQIRPARAGEKILALDDQTYELQSGDLVIADANVPQAIAGVMGGKLSGVTESTRSILLESAWFLPSGIRASAKRLGLSSDSSYRFERRVDPQGVLAARDRAVRLLQELAGAVVAGAPLTVGTLPAGRAPITLRSARVTRVLGTEFPESEVERILIGLGLVKQSGQWAVPSFRYDLEGEIDLIEELARVRGLKGIPARLHAGWAPLSATDRAYDKAQGLRHYLAARGWQECLTEAMLEGTAVEGRGALEIRNPITAQYTHLRPDLRAGLLTAVSTNLSQGNPVVRLFELGRCYQQKDGQIVEGLRLGLVIAGRSAELHWMEGERSVDLYDLPPLTDEVGLPPEVRISWGPVDAASLKQHGLKTKVYYAEYDLQAWLQATEVAVTYRPLPSFPPIRRDVALVVDRQVTHAQVTTALQKGKPAQLERVELFDVFQDDKGEKLPREKKSLAYALTYRAHDRTLTDKEVNAWHEQLLAKLKSELGCELRLT